MTASAPHGAVPPTKEQLAEHAGARLWGQIAPLRAEVLALQEPDAETVLAADDEQASPHHVSHAARRAMDVASEHLDALHALLFVAHLQHPAAPFTLLRATIESAAAAVWLLGPAERSERVLRSLRLSVLDAIDGDGMAKTSNSATGAPLSERREKIDQIATAVVGAPTHVGRIRSMDMLREAETLLPLPLHALAAWQICSGFAHGRLWATLSVLERDEVSRNASGDVTFRITSSTPNLTWAALVAFKLTAYSVAQYRRLGTEQT